MLIQQQKAVNAERAEKAEKAERAVVTIKNRAERAVAKLWTHVNELSIYNIDSSYTYRNQYLYFEI